MPLNLHSLAGSRHPLLVACNRCSHRASITGEQLGAHEGNMKELRHLKLHCAKCGARNYRLFLVHSAAHVEQFMSGDDLEKFKGVEV